MEIVKSFNLKDKPFTEKLFIRVAKLFDSSLSDLKEIVRPYKIRKIKEDKTVKSFAVTSVAIITQEINREVLERNNLEYQTLYTNAKKGDLPLIVLFTYCCTTVIKRLLEDEGVILNGDDLMQVVLSQFVIFDKNKKRVKLIDKGHELFSDLMNSKSENVLKWYNALLNAILIYIMSFENPNKDISEEDNIILISTLFEKLMSAYK